GRVGLLLVAITVLPGGLRRVLRPFGLRRILRLAPGLAVASARGILRRIRRAAARLAVAVALVARIGLLARSALPLRRIAAQRGLDQRAVRDRILHARLPAQRFVVGLEGVLEATGAGQRIAAVVGRVGPGQVAPDAFGLVVTTGAIGLQALAHARVRDLVGAAPGRPGVRARTRGLQARRQEHQRAE